MKFCEGLRKGLAIREKLGRPYCAAVIVAAGSSSRMGGTNKILTVLEKLPVICRTVDAFDRCSLIDEIIVVTQKDLMEKVSRYLAAYGRTPSWRALPPCRTRRSSLPSTTAHGLL